MSAEKTRNDLGEPGDLTAELPSLRQEHIEESEFIEFSSNLLPPKQRDEVLRHLDTCPRCREVLAALHQEDDGHGSTRISDPLLGRMLGEYKVEAALARGGMGAVYRGEQPMIGKKVAIKVLLPDSANDPDIMHRLLAEARAVNAIRHPNIIDIFSFGDLPDGRHYFVMELLDGLPLNELQLEVGKFTPGQVLTVLEQSMSALAAAHGAGVIHRDLKPANLFVTTLPDRSWHLTVLDFGLAKRLGAGSSTAPNMVMGTPGYMAPEQIRGQAITARTDLYAMGVVAWVMLTGEEPFNAPSYVDLMMKHLQAPLPSLARIATGCPAPLVKLIESLLEKKPDHRPASATDVLQLLQRIRKELDGHQTLKTPSPVIPAEELVKPGQRALATTVPQGQAAVRSEGPNARTSPADPGRANATTAPRGSPAAKADASDATRPLPGRGGGPVPNRAPADAETRTSEPSLPSVRSRPAKPAPAPSNDATAADLGRVPPKSLGPLYAAVAGLILLIIVGVAFLAWPGSPPPLPEGERVGERGKSPADAVKPEVAKPDPVTADAVPPNVATNEPDVAKPDVAKPDVAKPDVVQPEVAKPDVAKPEVAKPDPVKPRPTAPQLTAATLQRRLDQARNKAAALSNPTKRRMMNVDLDGLEKRLKSGEAPRTLVRELDDVLQNYGVP